MRAWSCCCVSLAIIGCGTAATTATTTSTDESDRCVDPLADAAARAGAASSVADVVRVDLDGRAPLDWGVPMAGTCGSGGCDWALYASAASCTRWVGQVRSATLGTTAQRFAGMRTLRLEEHAGSCDWTEALATVEHGRYRARDVRHCRCDAERGERCTAL